MKKNFLFIFLFALGFKASLGRDMACLKARCLIKDRGRQSLRKDIGFHAPGAWPSLRAGGLFSALFPTAWANQKAGEKAKAKTPPKAGVQKQKASQKKEGSASKALALKAKKPLSQTAPSGIVVEKILAQIGEDIISLIDFKNFRKQMSLGLIPSSLLLKNVFKKSQLLKDQNLLLEFMIARHILYQTAKKEENLPKLSSKQIDQALAQLKGKMSHKKFARRLKKARLNLKSLKALIAVDLTNDILLSMLAAPKVMVSEQEISARHFKQYQRALFKNFEYDFVSVQFSEDKKLRVLAALKKPSPLPLEKMAQRFDLEIKHSKLKDREIHKIFKAELERLSVSQSSPVIFLNGIYYILQLKWKTPIVSPKEKAIRDRLEQEIYKEKLKTELIQWVKEKKAGFFIKQRAL